MFQGAREKNEKIFLRSLMNWKVTTPSSRKLKTGNWQRSGFRE